jgi:rhodanese-related sulfurtransferase
MVVLAIGVRPESELARKAGLTLGDRGGIVTDSSMRTSDPHIFAVGDAVEVIDFVNGKPTMIPLAGPANRQARIAADVICGKTSTFRGTQGTAILKVFDLTAASTGNSEKLLERHGVPFRASFTHPPSHSGYYPGAEVMAMKLIFSPEDGKVLGAQIVGGEGVDKRIDVIATAIRGGMSVFDLEELELAYAPPYSSAKDPVNMAGFLASNILRNDLETVNWNQLDDLDMDSHTFLDVREEIELRQTGTLGDAVHIPIDQLRDRIHELDREQIYVVYCAVGQRGYVACRILMQHGFRCRNLSGGYRTLAFLRG